LATSECFVVNEWLIEDLRGANGSTRQLEGCNFLRRLKERCDRIAIPYGSVWLSKAYGLMTLHYSPATRLCSQYLHGVILHDPEKCVLLEARDIVPIPEDVRRALPEKDVYLAEAYYSASASALITTDARHFQRVERSIKIIARDDFLRDYLT